MAKAIAAWFGTSSTGKSVEVAQREDGVFFGRSYGWNGYGKAWEKWYAIDATFETHGTNAYSGERFEYDTPQMFWGFSKMESFGDDVPRFRLPNAVKAA